MWTRSVRESVYTHRRRGFRWRPRFWTGSTSGQSDAMECFWRSITASFAPPQPCRSRLISATPDRAIQGSYDEPPANICCPCVKKNTQQMSKNVKQPWASCICFNMKVEEVTEANRKIWRSSSTQLLFAPHHNLSFSSRAFRVSAPKIWNTLPLHIRQSLSDVI